MKLRHHVPGADKGRFHGTGMKFGPATVIAGYVKTFQTPTHSFGNLSLASQGIPLKHPRHEEDICITDEGADKLTPPESGKSTLGILLQRYLVRRGRNAIYLSMLNLHGDCKWALQSDAKFDIFWKEETGRTLGGFVRGSTQMDIIIDEAQILYGNVIPYFWFILKDLKSGTRNPHLRVLLIGMYGEEDCPEDRLSNLYGDFVPDFKIPEEVWMPFTKQLLDMLALSGTAFGSWRTNFGVEVQALRFGRRCQRLSTTVCSPIGADLFDGSLVYCLTAPQGSFGQSERFRCVSTNEHRAYAALRIEKIFEHSNHENARLYERAWQQEWYRAATTAIPKDREISPDVGPIFGATGFIDFYISGLEWDVEFLREGDDMKGHARRFSRGGSYAKIPLKHWAIVDFRHQLRRLSCEQPNFWHVLCADDYTNVNIRRLNKQPLPTILRGDDLP
ncbi:7508_t:CDS:2 [Ambispora leptoticha]|uniref:7508_t:CDS:1 n=1 Tax=Ambispora leptoticha TaxID=144679 RepID=A0A9N8VPL5_9GLOM|nr:7508_t:CDS:2 [Ambispora leptoticha]